MMSVNTLSNKYDQILSDYFEDYSKSNKPIEVSFRDLVKDLNNSERYTHQIHSYPAKLLMHIPHFFLNNTILSKPGSRVLDPFCGSGTVLLEAILSGRDAFGADANPLARLITKVKVTSLEISKLHSLKNKLSEKNKGQVHTYPDVVNLDYWFLPHVQNQLAKLLLNIESICEPDYKDFFAICLSQCIKRVSLSDPRISVPVRLRKNKYPENHLLRAKMNTYLEEIESINVSEKFFGIVEENIKRIKQIGSISTSVSAQVVSTDARSLIYEFKKGKKKIPDSYIDLVITSPPYAGAQKYVRASSLNLGWLNLASRDELRELEKKSIGREHFAKSEYVQLLSTGIEEADLLLNDIYKINPKRSCLASTYLIELDTALSEAIRVLKPLGFLVLVIGNNQVCGKEFNTQRYLESILVKKGLNLRLKLIDHIRSRGLMTKRNKTASMITREWVLIFQKMEL